MDTTIKRPDDKKTVTVSGQKREIFLSFKRLNSILRIIGDAENMGAVLVDPDTGEMVLRILLAPSADPSSALEFDLDEMMIDHDTVDEVLAWVQEHLTHFFMKRLQILGQQTKDLQPKAEALKSSLVGSEPSTSSDLFAGASA